jgi:hypothetical protein
VGTPGKVNTDAATKDKKPYIGELKTIRIDQIRPDSDIAVTPGKLLTIDSKRLDIGSITLVRKPIKPFIKDGKTFRLVGKGKDIIGTNDNLNNDIVLYAYDNTTHIAYKSNSDINWRYRFYDTFGKFCKTKNKFIQPSLACNCFYFFDNCCKKNCQS